MTKDEANRKSKDWHQLSMVCWCRDGRLCTACRSQDAIKAEVEAAGWNLFTLERKS